MSTPPARPLAALCHSNLHGPPARAFRSFANPKASASPRWQRASRCTAWLILPLLFCVVARAAEKPNLILLLADDMGYADVGAFGGVDSLTPNLDRLAAEGTRLTRFYASSAVCTPTRAAILTGRYPLHLGITRHFPDDERHLPPETVTLAELLQDAGYRTAHVGKWHLGGLHQDHIDNRADSIPGPLQHGFDEYLTQLEDPPVRRSLGREKRLYRDGGKHLVRNDRNLPPDPRHYTDINGDEAIAYIEKFHAEGKPFFVNVSWVVPHKPYEPAPEPFFGMYEGWASGDQRKFRSMVSHMDHKIGEIAAKLEELEIAEDTLIVFTSDNGGAYEADIGPFKGGKTDLHEGGLLVPFIAWRPGAVAEGAVRSELGASIDILPTFCAAAGIEPPKEVDGVNLLPLLAAAPPRLDRGPVFWQGRAATALRVPEPAEFPDRGALFWQLDLYEHLQRHYPKPKPYATEAVREGRWKLLAREGEPVELFDIEADPRERRNLLKERPQVVRRLEEKLQEWLAEPRLSPLR